MSKPARNSGTKKRAPERRSAANHPDADQGFDVASQILLWASFREELEGLVRLAEKGNASAIYTLVKIGAFVANALRPLVKANTPTIRRVIRESALWPTALFPSPTITEHFQAASMLRDEFNLGAECGMPLDAERLLKERTIPRLVACHLVLAIHGLRNYAQRKSEVNEICASHIPSSASADQVSAIERLRGLFSPPLKRASDTHLNAARRRLESLRDMLQVDRVFTPAEISAFADDAASLPPMSTKQWSEWFKLGRIILTALTNDLPEKCPALRDIGSYRADHYLQKESNTRKALDELKKKRKVRKTSESDIRDGIFTRLRSAFKVIAQAE